MYRIALVCLVALATGTVAGSKLLPVELRIPTKVIAAGDSGDVTISYSSGGEPISGLQCDLEHDESIVITAATAGSAALLGDKGLQTALLPDGNLRVMVVGVNQNVILDGDVIDLQVQVGASAERGRHALRCLNVVAVTPGGEETEVEVHQGRIIAVP